MFSNSETIKIETIRTILSNSDNKKRQLYGLTVEELILCLRIHNNCKKMAIALGVDHSYVLNIMKKIFYLLDIFSHSVPFRNPNILPLFAGYEHLSIGEFLEAKTDAEPIALSRATFLELACNNPTCTLLGNALAAHKLILGDTELFNLIRFFFPQSRINLHIYKNNTLRKTGALASILARNYAVDEYGAPTGPNLALIKYNAEGHIFATPRYNYADYIGVENPELLNALDLDDIAADLEPNMDTAELGDCSTIKL